MTTQTTTTDELSFEKLVTHDLEKLLKLWHRGELTTDQMVGHLFQHLARHEKRITALERGESLSGVGRNRP